MKGGEGSVMGDERNKKSDSSPSGFDLAYLTLVTHHA